MSHVSIVAFPARTSERNKNHQKKFKHRRNINMEKKVAKRKLEEANNAEIANKKVRVPFKLPIPTIPSISGTVVLTCGQGDMGQLGLGDDDDKKERKRPAVVASLKDIVDVCAGGMHNLCLSKDGIIYSFGCNDEGALGREGSEFLPAKINLPGKCVKISAGDSHTACLMEDGRVFAWGSFRDSHGNMGLTMDGNSRQPIDILPEITCCDIASGTDHLVILTCMGKVYTIGCAEQGQLGRVTLRSSSGDTRRGKGDLLKPGIVMIKNNKLVDAIWATSYCTFLREKGTSKIWAFGLNNYKQLVYPKDISVVTRPINIHCDNVKFIAGGAHHTLVLKNDSTCFAIGRKDYGRLGLGELTDDVKELQKISALDDKNIVSISCGESQSFAITQDGDLYSWGMGTNLQLGTGTEDDVLEPTHIVSKQTQDRHMYKASSGGQHSIFLVDSETRKNTSEAVSTAEKAVNNTSDDKGKAKETSQAKEANSNGIVTSDVEEPLENALGEKAAKPVVAGRPKRGRKKK